MAEYLSEEEQYKEILNIEEISRIRDPQLHNIRLKYWNLRHNAFLDEHNIPDSKLSQVWDELSEKEFAEIEQYKKSQIVE